jgi:cytochrome c
MMYRPYPEKGVEMQKFLAGVAVLAAMFAHGAMAADPPAGEALATRNGCMACHTVDKKVVGPGFKDVAAKYRSDKGAAAKLAQKVKQGGKGVWGEMLMPPNTHVKNEDIKAMVAWILSLK